MNKIIVVISLMMSLASVLQAQEHFETPSSPAFTILNFEPASVLRPTSPSELRTNVQAFFDKDGKFVPNMGLDVSPYWLKSHPELTSAQYLNPNWWQSIRQTFALSFATVKDTARSGNNFGVGIKFQPISGKTTLHQAQHALLNRTLNMMGLVAGVRGLVIDSIITTREQAIDTLYGFVGARYGSEAAILLERVVRVKAEGFTDTNASLLAFLQQLVTDLEQQTVPIEVPRIRRGILWEIAGASSFAHGDNNEPNEILQYGVWTTFSYKRLANEDFLLTLRWLRSQGDTLRSAVDLGVSYVRDFPRFSFSIEGVLRSMHAEFDYANEQGNMVSQSESNTTYRIAMTGQYKVNNFIRFNISIGKDYAQPFQVAGKFFSTTGLTFNLFRPLTLGPQ
jgi:hypothetical protein